MNEVRIFKNTVDITYDKVSELLKSVGIDLSRSTLASRARNKKAKFLDPLQAKILYQTINVEGDEFHHVIVSITDAIEYLNRLLGQMTDVGAPKESDSVESLDDDMFDDDDLGDLEEDLFDDDDEPSDDDEDEEDLFDDEPSDDDEDDEDLDDDEPSDDLDDDDLDDDFGFNDDDDFDAVEPSDDVEDILDESDDSFMDDILDDDEPEEEEEPDDDDFFDELFDDFGSQSFADDFEGGAFEDDEYDSDNAKI